MGIVLKNDYPIAQPMIKYVYYALNDSLIQGNYGHKPARKFEFNRRVGSITTRTRLFIAYCKKMDKFKNKIHKNELLPTLIDKLKEKTFNLLKEIDKYDCETESPIFTHTKTTKKDDGQLKRFKCY